MELSKAQDVEAGDGTTTVVVIAGSLLDSAMRLLEKGRGMTTKAVGQKLYTILFLKITQLMLIIRHEKFLECSRILTSPGVTPVNLSDPV